MIMIVHHVQLLVHCYIQNTNWSINTTSNDQQSITKYGLVGHQVMEASNVHWTISNGAWLGHYTDLSTPREGVPPNTISAIHQLV